MGNDSVKSGSNLVVGGVTIVQAKWSIVWYFVLLDKAFPQQYKRCYAYTYPNRRTILNIIYVRETILCLYYLMRMKVQGYHKGTSCLAAEETNFKKHKK